MRIEAGDVTFGYDESGSGKPLVLLHAFPLARQMWRPQLAELGKHARVIAPDLRGFGETSRFSGTPSVEQMADDVITLLDRLGISERIILGGLSMGGYVALAFARRHGARLRGLILADTRAEPDDATGKANRDRMIALTREHGSSAVYEHMIPKLLSDETRSNRPEVVEEVRAIAATQKDEAVADALVALRDRPDSAPLLASIQAPTLVIVGSEDGVTTPAMAEGLANGIERAVLMRIPGAGHLSNLEQPMLFNVAVELLLKWF